MTPEKIQSFLIIACAAGLLYAFAAVSLTFAVAAVSGAAITVVFL